MAIDDVDLFLLHQGSAAIIDVIVRKLRVSKDKVPMDIKDTGNTVSSSIPLLLEKFINDTTKENIIISGFGVGLSWATNLLRRVKKMLNIDVVIDAMDAAGISLDSDVTLKENQDIIFEDLGLDSLDLFNLFLELENLTDRAVPDEEVDNFKTISDILTKY